MLTVGVLGPLQVRRDGRLLAVPSGRTTGVLIRLAVDAGQLVRADQLIDDVWDGVPTGRNTLQSKVSQLRHALGDSDLIAAASGGYVLHVERGDVDALGVIDLTATVAAARSAADPAAVARAAAEGLALFRGEPLVDAGDGAWLAPHRARLEEVRLGLLEDLFAARVSLGAARDVIGELEVLVTRHPLREGLWSTLISALYRAGRQGDALAAYVRVRDLLADELGVDPGPGLRSLEEQILRQDPTLWVGPDLSAARVGNLPALTSELVGRSEDVAALTESILRHRLVTLVGPAGVGKTRLAIEVGRGLRPAGGVWLVRLDTLDDGGMLPRFVSEVLDVSGGEDLLVDRFAGADAVLVLDNCEHVLDPAGALVTRLLDGAEGLSVLVTSQVPLGLPGELVHPLAPLPPSDAVALFGVRAAGIRRDFVLDDESAPLVDEVCRALDGLPLAIELAAARVRSLSVREIARRLDDRFRLLRDPTSRAPERRRGLAAALGWSYDLLFPDDQRGLWAMSVFSGGAPLAAVESVLAALDVPAESAVDVVDRLVDRSLVGADVQPDGAVRYRVLDSIRAFARGKLADAGLFDAAATAHAHWFAGAADRCASTVRGAGQAASVAFARTERGNVDAALAWSASHDPAIGLRLAVGLGWTWVVLGDGTAGAARVRAALDAAGPNVDGAVRAEALLLAGWLEASAGVVDVAERDLDGALDIGRRLGDRQIIADTHRHLAFLRIQQGRPHDVLTEVGLSLDLDRKSGRVWEIAAGLLLASYGAIMLGDTTAASDTANEALGLLSPLGDSWGLVHARGMLGAIAQAEHRFDDAAVELASAVAESERLGFLGQAALHLTRWGRVEQQRGDRDAAVSTLNHALAAARRSGDLRIAATAGTSLARLLRTAGDDVAAIALLEQADRWYRFAGGDGALVVRALLAAWTDAGDLGRVLVDARTAGVQEAELVVLDALARRAAGADEPMAAGRWLSEADRVHAGIGHLVDQADRTDAAWVRDRLTSNDNPVPPNPAGMGSVG